MPPNHQAVLDWIQTFEDCVNAKKFNQGRELFYEDILCFGSHAEILKGLDNLVENQWQVIWPNITGFRFLAEKMQSEFSPDQKQVCVIMPWVSTGYTPKGETFERPGRVTVLLVWDDTKSIYRAQHTHYSLKPGTPNQTKKTSSSE